MQPARTRWRRLGEHAAFALSVVALDLLFLLPVGAARAWGRMLAVSGETAALILAVGLLARFGPPPRGWLGTWRAAVAAVLWTALWVFEVVRHLGHQAMNEQPLLFDLAALLRHLFVLGRDLLGARVYAVVLGAFVLVLLVGLLSRFLFARVEASFRDGAALPRAAILLAVVLLGIWPAAYKTRWTGPHLRDNLADSYGLWRELRADVRSDAYDALAAVRLERRPDVRIYVVESYGRILATHLRVAWPWRLTMNALEADLRAGGWHVASGWCTAPVSGGRSWIADASLMLGVRLAHQASYEHAIASVDRLHHLPRWFRDQGYQTVLSRPKDRARPGVPLVNHFRFEHTVFHDDLDYRGPAFGWGVIPDQHTIGFVAEEVLAKLPAPRFAFTHLVSSHVPWDTPPEVVDDWRALGTLKGARSSTYTDRELEDQLERQVLRYRREHEVERKGGADRLDAYWAALRYDLEVLRRHLAAAPAEPTVVVLMGDHQPPILGADGNDVPMHVLATDPALLDAFREAGFTDGMVPGAPHPVLGHEGFFSLLVRALVQADGQPPTPWYPEGASGEPR